MKLTKADLNEYNDLADRLDKSWQKIEKRINEVVKIICRAFGDNVNFVGWDPGEMQDIGAIAEAIPCLKKLIRLNDVVLLNPSCLSKLKDPVYFSPWTPNKWKTASWDYSTSFPLKFLFMPDADILEEVRVNIEETKRKEDADREKRDKNLQAEEEKREISEYIRLSNKFEGIVPVGLKDDPKRNSGRANARKHKKATRRKRSPSH